MRWVVRLWDERISWLTGWLIRPDKSKKMEILPLSLTSPPKITVYILKHMSFTITSRPISVSVPLTSTPPHPPPRAKTQTKMCVSLQKKRSHMYHKHAGQQAEPAGAGGGFTAGPLHTNNEFGHKIAERLFNYLEHRQTERLAGWQVDKQAER